MGLITFQHWKHSVTTGIKNMFAAIATKYDLVNAIISIGLHTTWNKAFVKQIIHEKSPHNVLDLCSGTGAIANCLLHEMAKRHLPTPSIDCVDFSPQMLDVAREKLKENPSIHCIQAQAENLPVAAHTYDTICLVYGIRNIQHKQKSIEEMFRVLKPSGTLHILELTQPKNRYIRSLHFLYLRTIVPFVGWVMTRKIEAYRYLRDSIVGFSIPPLLQQLQKAGFQRVEVKTYSLGAITYIRAQKS